VGSPIPELAPPALVSLRGVTRVYPRGSAAVSALDGLDLDVRMGEHLAIMGPSGSGKTTLLAIVGLLDRPSGGEHLFEGQRVGDLDDDTLSALRNRRIGFVFQAFHLLPHLSVEENVQAPLQYGATPPGEWRERARHALSLVSLLHRAEHRPSELSPGRSSATRASSSPTSPPATSTARPERRSPPFSTPSTRGVGRSWS
jgi:putative ABC transport system ATP-binding protein